MKTIGQTVQINVFEFFRKTMILYSYDEFANLISEIVKQADEPKKLSDKIKEHLN